MADSSTPDTRSPTPLIRKFVWCFLGFVGIGSSLAPILADERPGSILSLFSPGVRGWLIPLSGWGMGLIALLLQFASGERLSRARIRRAFLALGALTALALATLIVLFGLLTKEVSFAADATSARILIGFERSAQCGCPAELTDLRCLAELGPNDPLAVDSCWPNRSKSELWLVLAYLTTISGLGGLVGLVLLQEKATRSGPKRPRRTRTAPSPPLPT